MVATISVLTGGVGGVAAYFTATSGYYDVERTGRWFGGATEKLCLSGEVDRSDFEMLLAGHAPNGERLSRKMPVKSSATESPTDQCVKTGDPEEQTDGPKRKKRAERVPGFDLCFSAPKSVSLLWAVGSQEVRSGIESCMYEAVNKTLKDIESLLPLARRGRNGTRQVSAQLATAMFLHTTSRDLDPQLHIHSVLPNLCYGNDRRWGGINSRMLHNWTPTLGRVFRCHLGKALIERINVELERPIRDDGKLESWFEIKGVSKQVIKEFSQRRVAIEKATPRGKLGDSRARSKANEETRRAKDPSVDLKALGEQWRGRADSHGFNREKIDRICGQNNERTPLSTEKIEHVIEEAIQTVGREKAHFREWNVVSQVCESLQHYGVDATSVVPQVIEHLRQSPSVMPLDTNPRQQQYSTQKNWQLETELLADIDAMNESRGAVVSKKSIDNVCKQFQRNASKPFSKEQEQAVQKLLSDESSIRILTGVAGSGKSITLDAVREGFERQGYQVLGGALAGTAAQGLGEKTNISSRTVASYLHHLDKSSAKRLAQRVSHDARMMTRALLGKRTFKYEPVKIPQKSVLIIDEAGMLDTKTLSRLVHHVKKAKATLILVGDTHQLPPIRAGGPLDRASEKLGRARLSKNHRQLDQEDRKAVSELRAGKVEESLENYRRRDRLTVTRSHGETIQKIVEAWNNQGGTEKPEEQIILTQTRADAHEVNARCQQERLANKSIGGMGVRHGQTTYYRGDRVMFHIPMRKYGIENGFTGTITGTDLIRRSMTVRLDQTTSRVRGRKQSSKVTIPLSRLDHSTVSLGYAATTHKLQGATVDHALVLLGGKMLSRELAYTQLTRARKTTRLFASQDQAGKDLELLIKGMNRSVKKDLAHDVMERSDIPIPKSTKRQQPNQSLER